MRTQHGQDTQTRQATKPPNGWAASAKASLAGLAVLLLVLAGMLTVLKVRQDALGGSASPGVNAPMQLIRTLPGQFSEHMEWSPDGRILASAEVDEIQVDFSNPTTQTFEVKLWEVSSGSLIADSYYTDVSSLSWSPDSKMLAIGLDRNTIKVIDRTGHEIYTLRSPMPAPLAASSGDNLASYWWSRVSLSGYVRTLIWTPDSRTLITVASDPYSVDPVGADGVIHFWDMSTGKESRKIKVQATDRPNGAEEDGTTLVPAWVDYIQASPDGRTLASTDPLRLWDTATGQELQNIKLPKDQNGYVSSAWNMNWAPDGKTLGIVTNNTGELWDVQTGTLLQTLRGAVAPSPTPRLTPDPDPQGRGLTPMYDGPADVNYMLWSADGSKLAAVDSAQTVVWNGSGTNILYKLPTAVSRIGWSSDGAILATLVISLNDNWTSLSIDGGNLKLWDGASGVSLPAFTDTKTYNFAWSPDGRLFAVNSKTGITLWDQRESSAK